MKKLNKQQLEKLCKKWQDRLGLSQWDISILVEKEDFFGRSTNTAQTHFRKQSDTATVYIMQWEDRIQSDKYYTDMEHDLVHELMHIRFADIELALNEELNRNETLNNARECAIERTAKALILTERETKNG